LKISSGICLEGVRKTAKILSELPVSRLGFEPGTSGAEVRILGANDLLKKENRKILT
jgi:hypothetical protein